MRFINFFKSLILYSLLTSINVMGQSGWTNGSSYPVNRSGQLQSALNGGGMGAAYPYGRELNNYGKNQGYNNNNPSLNNYSRFKGLPSGSGTINSRPEGDYKFIASTLQEGNYWILILKDSTNTIRMKGSYSDQEMTIPDGMFYYYHSNGNTSMYGMYQQAQRNGIWISNYANGKLKDSISYSNGKKNGPFKRFHLNGSVYLNGIYEQENMQGTWLEYYENNQPASISNYIQNRLTSVVYYTKTGEKIEQEKNKPASKIFFNRRCEVEKQLIYASFYGIPHKLPNGKYECTLFNMEGKKVVVAHWWDPALTKKSGLFEQYDTTGVLRVSCYYDNNQLNGPFKTWYETGILSDSGYMKKNMADGIWESWYPSGQKKDSGEYDNDVVKDLWCHWDVNGNTRTLGAYGKYGRTGDWKTYDRYGKILFIERYRKSKNEDPEMIIINQK